jgi:divalent metal cation (Fe/Co/Zn/Cd) transporter
MHRLADGVDPSVITTAESAAGSVPGVLHAHARARWTGRTLRVEIEAWVDPDLPARDADAIGRQVATTVAGELPQAGSITWASRAGPSWRPQRLAPPGVTSRQQPVARS